MGIVQTLITLFASQFPPIHRVLNYTSIQKHVRKHVQFSVLSLGFFICFDGLWDDALSSHDLSPNPFQNFQKTKCSVFSFEFGFLIFSMV